MNKQTKKILAAALLAALCIAIPSATLAAKSSHSRIKLSKKELMDKIRGGWAGQVIGCTYGGPTEFRYNGRMIDQSVKIPWGDKDYIKQTMQRQPGLYDDVYMDLTFVECFDRFGVDAPTDSLAMAYALAKYPLWHANQAGRYNILHGVMPPESGHWRNNPHANDIDYQIEADYAGLMAPAMPNTASAISDRVGHIMNYGDGWYGGVYMGAMYSLAFTTDNVTQIVTEALKTIPAESKFHRAMSDVIVWYAANPDDWHTTWRLCQKKWSSIDLCPDGAQRDFNIDALINSAYVIIGLLYGEGDFGKTIDIATRCGQDSDCNPASAAGILGTAIGYDRIPDEWLAPLREAEDIKFAYTGSTLKDCYRMSFDHALQIIKQEGGKVNKKRVQIKSQEPEAVRFEESFPDLAAIGNINISKKLSDSHTIKNFFSGIVINGSAASSDKSYVARIEVSVDGKVDQIVEMPVDFTTRKLEIYYNFELRNTMHEIKLRWLNPTEGASVNIANAVFYGKRIAMAQGAAPTAPTILTAPTVSTVPQPRVVK